MAKYRRVVRLLDPRTVLFLTLAAAAHNSAAEAQAVDSSAWSRFGVPVSMVAIRDVSPDSDVRSVAVHGGADGEGVALLDVRVRAVLYRVGVVTAPGGEEARVREEYLTCVQLCPTPASSLYEWAAWTWGLPRNLRLVADSAGTTHVAWTMGTGVAFGSVAEPRFRSVALAEHLARREPWVRVPVGRLLPEARRWGMDAQALDIRVQSIEKRGEDGWEVEITGPDEEKVYTLIGEAGEWRLAE